MIWTKLKILANAWLGLLYQKSFCKEWDKVLNSLLDQHENTARLGYYTVWLGTTEVWVGNPFCVYGTLWTGEQLAGTRPSLHTMARLYHLVLRLEAEQLAKAYLDRLNELVNP